VAGLFQPFNEKTNSVSAYPSADGTVRAIISARAEKSARHDCEETITDFLRASRKAF
jgi:hypothetical protein